MLGEPFVSVGPAASGIDWMSVLTTVFSTLFSTIGGGLVVIWAQRRQHRDDRQRDAEQRMHEWRSSVKAAHRARLELAEDRAAAEATAGRMAQLTVLRQLDSVVKTKSQLIDPARNHPLRYLAIRPSQPDLDAGYRLNIPSLSFLATKRHAALLDELAKLTLRFVELQALVQLRNDQWRTVQITLASKGIVEAGTPEQIAAATNPFDRKMLESYTDHYVAMTDELAQLMPTIADKLYEALTELFPGKWAPKIGLAEATGTNALPEAPGM